MFLSKIWFFLVALTGYGQDTDRQRSLAAGFDLHLVKPVEPQKLQAALEALMRSPSARDRDPRHA